MRILVVGAGIGGLLLALLLRQRGLRPRIIEQRAKVADGGYVLGLWPLGSDVLKGLDLFGAFERASLPLKRFCLGDDSGRVLDDHPVEMMKEVVGLIRMVKRSDLVELLARAAAEAIDLSVHPRRIRETANEVVVELSDGSTEAFDLVVGCDGIHSRVSAMVGGSEARRLDWTGCGWWVDAALAHDDRMIEYWSPGKHFCAVLPCPGAAAVFVGCANGHLHPGSSEPVSVQEMARYFESRGELRPELFAPLHAGEGIYHTPFYVVRRESYHAGRIVLVGDAASASFPFGGLGIGASMAMESAAVLAEELTRVDARSVPRALRNYEMRRRPRLKRFEAAADAVVETTLSAAAVEKYDVVAENLRQNFALFRSLLERPI